MALALGLLLWPVLFLVPFVVAGLVARRIYRESGFWRCAIAFVFVLIGMTVAEGTLLLGGCFEMFGDLNF